MVEAQSGHAAARRRDRRTAAHAVAGRSARPLDGGLEPGARRAGRERRPARRGRRARAVGAAGLPRRLPRRPRRTASPTPELRLPRGLARAADPRAAAPTARACRSAPPPRAERACDAGRLGRRHRAGASPTSARWRCYAQGRGERERGAAADRAGAPPGRRRPATRRCRRASATSRRGSPNCAGRSPRRAAPLRRGARAGARWRRRRAWRPCC